ncbi:MAG TPA: biotin/lipoyl-containing protein [Chthonomonadaceae bacterium]|nr:biotin/lipoyl-containing protein [Chthonomonadaceae bacterium]
MQLSYQVNEKEITLQVEPEAGGARVILPDGTERRIRVARLPDDVLRIAEPLEAEASESAERTFLAPFARTPRGVEFSLAGQTYVFTPAAVRREGGPRGGGSGTLTAPMVGVVAEMMVVEGQAVEAYQPLAVIEAMKVMATVEAPFAGTVKAVHVHKGQHVEHGAPLVEVMPKQEEKI